ncbi:hypothetical protein ACS0TY_007342 [Phlomoides rotata]
METHVSRWYDVESVPQSHTFPGRDRPGEELIPVCRKIPIIDLGEGKYTVEEVIKASQEYGFFQVTNHGVSEDLIGETVKVMEELLLSRSAEEIWKEANENGWVYMGSSGYPVNGVHLWRDNLKHSCHPLDKSMQHWPLNPTRYREVVGAYIKEIRRLSLRILEVISEGLGLEKGWLGGISQVQFLTASNYPRCPDPTRTLGLLKHLDHSLITILFQGNVEGLQVMKDGNWIGVPVVPNAFVVNIGTQLQIISNGKVRSAEHRVVTNRKEGRTSIATFTNPSPQSIIEPAKVCVDQVNPPLYPPHSFKDFVNLSKPFGPFTHLLQN